MTPFRILWARLRGLAGLGWRDADLDEEIATHLDLLAGQYRRRGLSASAARLAARRDFGGLSQTRESYRAQRAFAWLDAIVRDLRFGVRVLRRNPGLATVVVATLGITIGANAVVFSLVDHLLLRPLPFPAPDRLVTIARHAERGTRTYDGLGQDGATWMFLRDHGPALDVALEAGGTSGVNALVHGNAAYVQQRRVSAGYFRVLGIQPFIGREFTADEDRDGGAPVTILSYRFWNRALGADPSAIGHDILLRGERFTIVGVMPSTLHSIAPTDLWTPLHPSTQGEGAGGNYVLLGRLRPGIGLEAARAQVESVGTAFLQDRFHPPADVRMTMRIVPFQQVVTSDIHDRLVVVWVTAIAVLLIGCVNIAGLMLVRCFARRGELATRIALGGGRAALIRQLLAESLIFAVCGGAAGVVLGYALSRLVAVRMQAVLDLPIQPDARVLGVVAAASTLTTILFGLVPALHASRTDVRRALVESGAATVVGPSRRWPVRALVMAQVMIGVALVIAAGLAIRTFQFFNRLTPGFDGTNVIAGTVSLEDARYRSAARVNDLFDRSLGAIERLPDVESAAVALTLPYERAMNQGWRFEGASASEPEPISLTYVTKDYFAVLRIPVVRGRAFGDFDTASSPHIVIVNEAFVRRYSPDRDPIGRRILSGDDPLEIVGIVGNIQQRANFGGYGPLAAVPAAYVTASQGSDGGFGLVHTWFEPSWIVRTRGPNHALGAAMQRALTSVDPELPFNRFRTLDDVRDEATANARMQAMLIATAAAVALLLCALGVYGLVAYSVQERRRELGLRLALGATRLNVLSSVTRPAVAMAICGAGLGIVLAAGLARGMRTLVYGVDVRDPLTYTAAVATVVASACLAAVVPAARALRTGIVGVLNGRE